jgi:hypothetical protein
VKWAQNVVGLCLLAQNIARFVKFPKLIFQLNLDFKTSKS